jgi:hypothetical protein
MLSGVTSSQDRQTMADMFRWTDAGPEDVEITDYH